jgi:hypothetical protein
MGSISVRVARRASRLKVGKDFSSPEELAKYLEQHPDADRTKHRVEKSKAPKGGPDKPSGKPPAPKAPPPPPAAKAPVKPEAKPSSKPPPIPEAAKKKPAPKTEDKPAPAPKAPTEDKGHHDEHDEHDDAHGHAPAKPGGRFDGWKKSLKGLKESAANFVEKAPKSIKSFLGDPDFRKSALKEAKTAVTKLPKATVNRLVETAKEEVHEFQTAAHGIKAMMSGKKMTKHQKHAFRAVATHVAIGATAAAFAATGPLAGAAIFAKGLARHVALKSVKKAFGNLHVMDELSHIGHGIEHLIEHIASEGGSKKDIDPEEAMTNLILAAVAKEIEQLKDEDFTQVLNKIGEGGEDEDEGEDDEEGNDKTAALAVLRRFLP